MYNICKLSFLVLFLLAFVILGVKCRTANTKGEAMMEGGGLKTKIQDNLRFSPILRQQNSPPGPNIQYCNAPNMCF